MIFILTFLGLALLWLSHLTDAKTKYPTNFIITRWIEDEGLSICMTAICATVLVILIVYSNLQGKTFDVLGYGLRADYCLAFLSGYSGSGIIARISSIISNMNS